MIDKAKLVVALAVVGLGVWGYYWLADYPLVVRVLTVIAGLLVAGAVAWWSEPGKQFAVFAGESVAEVKKVVWPTRNTPSTQARAKTRVTPPSRCAIPSW